MDIFYQIVTKQEVDGNWIGFFIENLELYNTYEDAYQKALDLALKHIQGFFNDHLKIKHHTEDENIIIQIFNPRINDVEKEYHIQKLTVA